MPPASDESGAYMDEASAAAAVAADRQKFLIKSFNARANEAMSNGDYDAAKDLFAKALDIDASDEEANAGLANLMSDRPSTTSAYMGERTSVESVRRQQAAAEVRNYLDRGRTLEGQENYGGAVKEYRKALAIISWYDETADFGMSAERIRDLIDRTNYKSELSERASHEEQIRVTQAEQENELNAERERRLGRMHAYFAEANVAFRQGNYNLAREYAQQILREDPTNDDAERMMTISYDAQHMQEDIDARHRFDDQWKKIMKDVEVGSLPQVRTVEFPEDWLEEIAHRQPRTIGDEDSADEDATLGGLLSVIENKRVQGLNWEDASLDDAVALLRTLTGLNFFITAKAREEKGEDVQITLKLDDVSVSTILDLITEDYELKWIAEGGVIKIATKDEVSGTMRLRYFDVKDLNVAIQNFVGQEINLTPSNFTPPEPPELPDPLPIFPAENLPDLIRETIGGEGSWDDPANIEARNGILIVRNTKKILNQIGKLLSELRANTGILVNLEVRFLTAEDNFLRDVGVDVRGLGDNSQGIGVPGLGTAVVQDDVFFGQPGNPFGVPFGVNPEPSSVGTANDAGIFYNDGGDGAYAGRVENLFELRWSLLPAHLPG